MPTTEIKILFVRNDSPIPKELWGNYLSLLPQKIHPKVERYHFWKDKQASLFSKLLLSEVLHNETDGLDLSDVKYGEHRKPYLDHSLSFNVTHSGGYVVCAYGHGCGPIGLDIEKMDVDTKLEDFQAVFSPAEWLCIKSDKNPLRAFYDFWTIKESAVKADGRGLIISLDKVWVQDDHSLIDDTRWFFKEVKVAKDYKCHLALQDKNCALSINETNIFDVYQSHLEREKFLIS